MKKKQNERTTGKTKKKILRGDYIEGDVIEADEIYAGKGGIKARIVKSKKVVSRGDVRADEILTESLKIKGANLYLCKRLAAGDVTVMANDARPASHTGEIHGEDANILVGGTLKADCYTTLKNVCATNLYVGSLYDAENVTVYGNAKIKRALVAQSAFVKGNTKLGNFSGNNLIVRKNLDAREIGTVDYLDVGGELKIKRGLKYGTDKENYREPIFNQKMYANRVGGGNK